MNSYPKIRELLKNLPFDTTEYEDELNNSVVIAVIAECKEHIKLNSIAAWVCISATLHCYGHQKNFQLNKLMQICDSGHLMIDIIAELKEELANDD